MDPKLEQMPIPEADLSLSQRLDILTNEIKAHGATAITLSQKSSELPEDSRQIVESTKKVASVISGKITDLDWLSAMQESGLSEEQIVKIWNKKFEVVNTEKDLQFQGQAQIQDEKAA